jgi:hypothetical protein
VTTAAKKGRTISASAGAPKYVFSGLTKCARCGGGYTMISAELIGCATSRNKGACDNRTNIRRDRLEERVLNALRYHLMSRGCSRSTAMSSLGK